MDASWLFAAGQAALETAFDMLLSLLPYTIFGVLIGEALKLTSQTKLIYSWIQKNKWLAVFVATLVGTLSPLCTYGTIPVVIALYSGGVSIPPLVAFLASSSLMNPQLFVMTWGGLGIEFALMRVAICIVFSLICGYLLYLVPEEYIVKGSFIKAAKTGNEIMSKPVKERSLKVYLQNCYTCLKYILFYLVMGVLAGAVIETFIPSAYVLSFMGGNTILSILAGALAGIPFYACGGGVIPVVLGLMNQGMSMGAAMAFVTVGQATRISPLAALASFLRPAFIVAYCLGLILFSVLVGILL